MPQDPGRRHKDRSDIELRVDYRRLNTFFYDYTRNISQGGTFIRTRRPLPIGTRFRFCLTVPSLEQPLVLHGEVRWVRREGEGAPGDEPGMGIQFLFDDDRQREAVDRVVERLMVGSLGQLIYSHLRSGSG